MIQWTLFDLQFGALLQYTMPWNAAKMYSVTFNLHTCCVKCVLFFLQILFTSYLALFLSVYYVHIISGKIQYQYQLLKTHSVEENSKIVMKVSDFNNDFRIKHLVCYCDLSNNHRFASHTCQTKINKPGAFNLCQKCKDFTHRWNNIGICAIRNVSCYK